MTPGWLTHGTCRASFYPRKKITVINMVDIHAGHTKAIKISILSAMWRIVCSSNISSRGVHFIFEDLIHN